MAQEKTDENFEQIMEEVEKEEQSESETPAETNSEQSSKKEGGELEYPHRAIMEEEGLKRDDLPADIREMIITFDRKLNMADKRKGKESTYLEIQKLSALISDKIMDFLEKDATKEADIKEKGGEAAPEVVEEEEVAEETEPIEEEEIIAEEGGEQGEEEEEDEEEDKGMFGGILGGVLDW